MLPRAGHGRASGRGPGEGWQGERGTLLGCSPQGHPVPSGFGAEPRDGLGHAIAKWGTAQPLQGWQRWTI